MRGEAMKKICKELQNRNFPLNESHALEFFAREGDWQTQVYSDKVRSLEAWEIDPKFEAGLKANLPKAKIRITDSFQAAKEKENLNHFDFIVLDNPQGLYGNNSEYCEHFEALSTALPMLKKDGVLIFNINWAPFDSEKHPEWMKRRSNFYESENASHFTIDFLLSFYKNYFEKRNRKVAFSFATPRNNEYLSYLVFRLH